MIQPPNFRLWYSEKYQQFRKEKLSDCAKKNTATI